MHQSVLDFLGRCLPESDLVGRSVLEVGSYDVNGSPRDVLDFRRAKKYVGVDIAPGPGVDLVCASSGLVGQFGLNTFDTVISTEMLEHVDDWRVAVSQMKRVLCPGGLLIVTTRSPGFPYHPHPVDYWRFTLAHFRAMFKDLKILELASDLPGSPGVLMSALKPAPFRESSLVEIEVDRPEVP